MKTKILSAIAALVICSTWNIAAQNLTSLFDLTPANGTTNGTGVYVSGVRVPVGTVFVQLGGNGITNAIDWQTNVVSGVTNIVNTRTNIIHAFLQASVDNANWITIDNFYPLTTNGPASGTNISNFGPSNSVPMYLRVQLISSNSIPVGVFKQ